MGADGLGGASVELPAPLMSLQPTVAAVALVEQIHAAAKRGDFSLVMLGPLTNLALALALDPELPRLVPHLVIMGGAVEARGNQTPVAEFNFYADPEAAGVVFRAGFPQVDAPTLGDIYEAVVELGGLRAINRNPWPCSSTV